MTMAEQHRLSAREAATLIRVELDAGDTDFALRFVFQAISDMRKAGNALDDFLIQPESTGSRAWDTLFATAILWQCERAGVPAPSWSDMPPLGDDWIVWPRGAPGGEWADRIRAATPEPFRVRRIFIRERDFTTA